jgi:hypothetical protein
MIDDPRILAARLIAASPLSMSIAEARAQTQDRRHKLLAAPPAPISQKAQPDFAPAPMPIIDDPATFAENFHARTKPSVVKPQKSKPKKSPPGRKPVGGESLGPKHEIFRVIDGDKDGDKPKGE